MGFYFRKSVSFGPVRFNFSKSGIGVSVGVKGARISTGPRGTYVHAGRHGFYYRQRLDSPHPRSPQPIHRQPEVNPRQIRAAPFAIMAVLITTFFVVLLRQALVSGPQSTRDQPLPKETEVATTPLPPIPPTPAPFVVLPGKFVGNFSLGMSKEDVLKIAPKPQENSLDHFMYRSPKTGN